MNPIVLLYNEAVEFLSTPAGWIVSLAVVFLFGRKFARPAFRVAMSFPAFLVWAFSLVAFGLWRPAAAIVRRLFPKLPSRIATAIERLGTMKRSPLHAGNREMAARAWWPEEVFPFLYRPVPHDIVRPLHQDGKLVGGVNLTWLADRHMTRTALVSAIHAGLVVGLILLVPAFIAYANLIWILGRFVYVNLMVARPVLEQWPGLPAIVAPQGWWTSAEFSNFGPLATYLLAKTFAIWIPWGLFALGGAIAATATALKVWHLQKGMPYTLVTKDADVRWGSRVEARNLSNAVYRKQIELSEGFLKDTPVFRLGIGTGISRLRGDLAAPEKGQLVCLDRESLFQHLLVFGGTGEGKTTAILKPLMRQLMEDRQKGFYICDAKGVLWQDALKVAQAAGREDDVTIIGTGEGQCGVDPLAKLTPTQIAATLRSVLNQVGAGGSGDNFWPDMAANVLRHILTIAQTYRLTEAGKAEELAGLNPYSLWWAYQTALSIEQLASVIGHIKALGEGIDAEMDQLRAEGRDHPERRDAIEIEFERLANVISPETNASLFYIESTWATMAPETKSGIVANITQLLDGFAGSRTLRERFACGRSDGNTVELSQALEGRIVLNALSSIEDGLPARLVLIMLKTTLYREARVREAAYKAMTPRKDPQKAPCIVIMDEVQEIATSDPASGLSDATFWNVARSTGLAGIFATQTLAALKQALGDNAAANFVQQARSKVFFRSEDAATADLACWCAGTYERNRVFEDGQRESIDHRQILDGWDPFAPVDEQEPIRGGSQLFRSAASNMLSLSGAALTQTQRRNVYEPDLQFVATLPSPAHEKDNSTLITGIQMRQGAVWRAEDLERQYRSQGNDQVPALTPSDLIGMGRWHAFAHVQRAGAARQDIIVVEHDYA